MFRFLLRKHPILTALLAAALAGFLWFTTGFVRETLYFSDPEHQQQDLALWMSPAYVGKSWGLPPEIIVDTMDLEPEDGRLTLKQVTERMGITIAELQVRIQTAKTAFESRHHRGRDGDHGADHGGEHDGPPKKGPGMDDAGGPDGMDKAGQDIGQKDRKDD